MTLDNEFSELVRMLYLNYIVHRAVEGKEYKRSINTLSCRCISHSISKKKEYYGYLYFSTYSLDLIRNAVYGLADELCSIQITRDVQTQQESPLCYGTTIPEKIMVMKKIIKFPYLYRELMGKDETWWRARFLKSERKSFGCLSDEELQSLNNAIHELGIRLRGLKFEWEEPTVDKFYLIDICKEPKE